jgi:AcrR family transcriptional regulator
MAKKQARSRQGGSAARGRAGASDEPTPKKRSEEAAASNRRADIIRVAGELFAQRGYRATTVRDIRDRVGMLSGSLYYHFKTKDEILHELMTAYEDDLLSNYASAVEESGDFRSTLRCLLRAGLRAVVDYPNETGILHAELKYFTASGDFDYIRKMMRRIEDLYVSAIQSGIAAGEVRPDVDPALIYRMVMDVLKSASFWYDRYDPRKHDIGQLVDAWVGIFVDGIGVR